MAAFVAFAPSVVYSKSITLKYGLAASVVYSKSITLKYGLAASAWYSKPNIPSMPKMLWALKPKLLSFNLTVLFLTPSNTHGTAFPYGATGAPYIEVYDVASGTVLQKIFQARNASSRLASAAPFAISAGVTQVKFRMGTSGAVSNGPTNSLVFSRPKLEAGLNVSSYVPGIASEPNGGLAAIELNLGTHRMTIGSGAPISGTTPPGLYINRTGAAGSFLYASPDGVTWTAFA